MRYAQHGGDFVIENPGKVTRRAARIGRRLMWPAVGAFAATLLATAARLLGPLAVRSGIDDGITRSDTGMITRASIVFGVLLGLQYLFSVVSRYAVAWVGEQFLLDLRSKVFGHLLRLDMGFYSRSKTGVLVSRMTSDIESLQEFVSEAAVMALTNLLTVIGVAVAMLLVDWQLALVVFAIIAVLIAISVVFQRQAGRAYSQVRERIGRVLGALQEGIAGVRVVQAFTQETTQAGEFGRVNEYYYDANMSAALAITWYFPTVAFVRVVATGAVLFFGGAQVIDGGLTFGTLVVFLLYLNWFFEPVINLANVYNLLQAAVAALAKLFALLDERPAVQERPGAYDLAEPVRGQVRFDGVSFGYDPLRPVVHGIEIDVPPGQRLAVVGETGAGKSTIAKLAMRFYDPDEGAVTIDGADLRDLTKDSRQRALALIPQDGYLFNGTLRDNLKYGRPDATDTQVWDVLRAMGVDTWIRSLADGLDTAVRERGSRFSAGERQLVALARAFLADPGIIVLDEATSNLDPETEVQVEGALRVLLAGRTAIVIAHRLRSAQRADRVVMIDDGRIIGDGSHADLVASNDKYRELVEVWERGTA
jgi:ATP-binding cassette subfamily B protein